MITDAFLTLPLVLIQSLIGFLPAYSGLSTTISSALSGMISQMAGVMGLFPMTAVKYTVLTIMATEIAIFLFHAGAWIFHWRQK